MRILLLILLSVLLGSHASSDQNKEKDPIKVVVIDTGFDFNSSWKKYDHFLQDGDGNVLTKPKLCDKGHKDFTGTGLKDNHGHGTHVAGIIGKYAGNANYCLVIVKTYDKANVNASKGTENVRKALLYAKSINADIVNYSGGGPEFSVREYLAVKKVLDDGIVLVAAAGNEKMTIDNHVLKVDIKFQYIGEGETIIHSFTPHYINRKTSKITTDEPKGTYYPASYDPRIISVVNVKRNGDVAKTSNRGSAFSFKEVGTKVLSILPNNSIGYMTGTSQAAPTRTGKIIKSWDRK